jgi:hypothetical protein
MSVGRWNAAAAAREHVVVVVVALIFFNKLVRGYKEQHKD